MTEMKPKAMRDVFLQKICDRMEVDDSLFFITADFGSPVLDKIFTSYPDRIVNVGIAEQNLINISTGLALEGYNVYAYAIAPFITMRCFEQIKVNLSLLSTLRTVNVNLIGVGAGFSYVVSGPTHHSIEDISIMRTLPNIEIISPADWRTAELSFDYSLSCKKPKYFRFDSQPLPAIYNANHCFDDQGFKLASSGADAVIVATGYMVRHALKIANMLRKSSANIAVIDLYKLKSADRSLLSDQLKSFKYIFSMEEAFIGKGGLDSFILNLINDFRLECKFKSFGMNDEYKFAIGSRQELLANYGLSANELNDIIIKDISI